MIFTAPLQTPEPSVNYTRVLARDDDAGVTNKSLVGLLCVFFGYLVVVMAVAYVVVSLGWLLRGRPGTLAEFASYAMHYEYPEGLLGSHLGLATMTLICFGVVYWIHRVPPRWLVSVQPGMRWRYLLACLLVACVALNAIYWLSRIGQPFQPDLPSNASLWFSSILIASPLQAAGEEFVFRGYLMQSVGTFARSPWVSVAFSAAIFAMMHGSQNLPLFVDRLGFGLLAGGLVVLTGGLEAAIAAHVINNVFSFGYATLTGTLTQAHAISVSSWTTTGWDLAAYAITFAGCWFVGKKMNVARKTPNFVSGAKTV